MNPLLVTGLVAVGQKLIDNLITKHPDAQSPSNPPSGVSFERHLDNSQAIKPPSELIHFLEAKGIRDGAGFQHTQFQLRQQLFNQPELAHFMAQADRTAGFQLTLSETGLYTLTDSAGKQITFSPETPAGQLAHRIRQMNHMEAIAEIFPGYGMRDLAYKAEEQPPGMQSWHLPGMS